jgi:hypothetical protein
MEEPLINIQELVDDTNKLAERIVELAKENVEPSIRTGRLYNSIRTLPAEVGDQGIFAPIIAGGITDTGFDYGAYLNAAYFEAGIGDRLAPENPLIIGWLERAIEQALEEF